MPNERKLPVDYGTYFMNRREKAFTLLCGAALGGAVCWLCYHSLFAAPVGAGICILFYKMRKKALAEKRKKDLLYHFKDFLSSLNVSMRSGLAIENGIEAAYRDTELLYGEKDCLTEELRSITAKLKVRVSPGELFADLGERSDLEDIRFFAELLAITEKTGGNISRMLENTSGIICEKIDTSQEIDAQNASVLFEQKIMSIMPAAIILYMRFSFPGFVEMLYGNLFGAGIMTGCLILYGIAFFWGQKLVRIEI